MTELSQIQQKTNKVMQFGPLLLVQLSKYNSHTRSWQ